MKYQDVAAASLAPVSPDLAVPDSVSTDHPARRLRDAIEPLAMHAVWSPLVHERAEPLGLDFFMTYVWGRACVLGEPTGAVVASAFGSFQPAVIAGVYDAARGLVDRTTMVDLVWSATGESLRATLADDAGADDDAAGQLADRLLAAVAELDAVGLPLFAAVQALERPADPFAALWQACLALREHRGDIHLAAYGSAGPDAVEMNILTECWLGYPLGEYSGTRAWPEDRTAQAMASLEARGWFADGSITDGGRTARAEIEARTDERARAAVDAIGSVSGEGGFDAVVETLASWSDRCVAAGVFPADPRKRAAG
ncbi:MAG: SCO6745 family protein [Acidimicrobiales bacterium]